MAETPSHQQLQRYRHSVAQIDDITQSQRCRPRANRTGSLAIPPNGEQTLLNLFNSTQPAEFSTSDLAVRRHSTIRCLPMPPPETVNRNQERISALPPPVPKRNYIPPANRLQGQTIPPSVPPRLPPSNYSTQKSTQHIPPIPPPISKSQSIKKQFQNTVPVNSKLSHVENQESSSKKIFPCSNEKPLIIASENTPKQQITSEIPTASGSRASNTDTEPKTTVNKSSTSCNVLVGQQLTTASSVLDYPTIQMKNKFLPPSGSPPIIPNNSTKCFSQYPGNNSTISSPTATTISSKTQQVTNVNAPLPHAPSTPIQKSRSSNKVSIRQDSSVSSDSFSQTSSPSYTTKTMETPLLPHHAPNSRVLCNGKIASKLVNSTFNKNQNDVIESKDPNSNAPLTKSASTPASLQTIVRFHNGSNMSLHHRIIRDMRRPSGHYVSRIRLRFRLAQVVVNAIALLAIGGGLAAYFKAYPSSVKIVSNNITTAPVSSEIGLNPAPGICLPVIVNFCQHHRVPYNFTVFPNYMGHFGQRDAQQELEVYDAVVDVRCYELAALFLCSVFVPKCGPAGQVVRPCRSLCFETKRRCGFFLDVFGLALPDYLECSLFPESPDPDVCVGHYEFREAQMRALKPVCTSGFQCDGQRCIPKDWQCDGHVDCKDQSDELNCVQCSKGMIHCGAERCMAQEHMCDGKVDCPWAQDERNCLRLSERNGDEGHGKLEVFRPEQQHWVPACVAHWDQKSSPDAICNLLGYGNSNSSRLMRAGDSNISPPVNDATVKWRMHPNKRIKKNLLKEFGSCSGNAYPTVDLSCINYVCGKVRKSYAEQVSKRIIGGSTSKPGDWPFLAALLGGPEEVFYCAGVLISDQWVLTASHCVGNHSDVTGWTIQLGITRRHAHSYYGQKMKVKRVLPHPMYNLGIAHDNDVALFQLASPVTFHEHLLPVCLPPPNKELLPGTVCTVIGWGKKEDKDMSEYEPAINEVEVPVLNRDLCNTWLENRDLNVTDGMICAGYKEGGKDACQGDSGGPLLCRDDSDSERWFVGGIVSWGIKCAHPQLPGVYAYVPKYIPWIKQQMNLYSDSPNR